MVDITPRKRQKILNPSRRDGSPKGWGGLPAGVVRDTLLALALRAVLAGRLFLVCPAFPAVPFRPFLSGSPAFGWGPADPPGPTRILSARIPAWGLQSSRALAG